MRLAFGEKWLAAGLPLQILSIAAAFRVVTAPAASLIQAQGRFSLYSALHVISGLLFVLVVAISTYLAGMVGTATGVLTHATIAIFLFGVPAFRAASKSFSSISSILVPACLASEIALCVATVALAQISGHPNL